MALCLKYMEECTEILLNFDSGQISAQDLVEWAINHVQTGHESQNLNELAWLIKPEKNDARRLFIKAIDELNLSLPSQENMDELLIMKYAQQIINCENNANDACSKIAQISEKLNSPKHLLIFELLAHEQNGHEHIGITAENIRPAILKAAENLLNET